MHEEEAPTGRVDVSRTLTDAMAKAGVHPAYVHAVRVCGFVYTEENASSFAPEDVARWEAAIEAWFADNPDAPPPGGTG